MRPPWLRALTGCLQMVVRSNDDVEVDKGEVNLGELRARAFADLQSTLTDAQRLSLAWFALADLACWPQLPATEAAAVAQALETGTPIAAALLLGKTEGLKVETPQDLAATLLRLIHACGTRLAAPAGTATVDMASLRLVVNRQAHESGEAIQYWEKWLRRVVPAAVMHDPASAKSFSIKALRATLSVAGPWAYEAGVGSRKYRFPGESGTMIRVVSPRRGGQQLLELGAITDEAPKNRKIQAKLTPRVPIDAYRMGYLFRSILMTDLLDDAHTGHYDTVTCTNTSTGDSWSYDPL